MPNKLRLSYSLISAWERGNVQDAVEMYFHVGGKMTPQIQYGIDFHKDMADHITKYNSFPDWFFKGGLKLPQTEKELIVPYNDLFDIKAIFDCYDNPDLYEFKTGVQDSLEWSRTLQLPMYFLVAEIDKMEIDKAIVIRHNQYKKESDYAITYNTKKLRDKARNAIDSTGPEIYKYFDEQGLL
jgi:hypothetical protein